MQTPLLLFYNTLNPVPFRTKFEILLPVELTLDLIKLIELT